MKNKQKELILKNYGEIFTIETEDGRILKSDFHKNNPAIEKLFNKNKRR